MTTQTFMGYLETTQFGRVELWRSKYMSNEALAVMLQRNGEQIAVLSVNMDEGQDYLSDALPPNVFYMKAWGENETLARDAANSGWFKRRYDFQDSRSGFVRAQAWELLRKQETLAGKEQQIDTPAPTPAPTEEGRWAYTPGGAEPVFEPAPKFESGGGGDMGGGGADAAWKPGPAYTEPANPTFNPDPAPSPAYEPPAPSPSYDSGSSSPPSDSGSSGGGGSD